MDENNEEKIYEMTARYLFHSTQHLFDAWCNSHHLYHQGSSCSNPSNKAYAEYLCQNVFSDMSVLPLVFPSNISCFSRGSYKEELTRRRELPVPPVPKRSGVWARSNEDIPGSSSSGSVSPVSSISASSNIVRYTSDSCLRNSTERSMDPREFKRLYRAVEDLENNNNAGLRRRTSDAANNTGFWPNGDSRRRRCIDPTDDNDDYDNPAVKPTGWGKNGSDSSHPLLRQSVGTCGESTTTVPPSPSPHVAARESHTERERNAEEEEDGVGEGCGASQGGGHPQPVSTTPYLLSSGVGSPSSSHSASHDHHHQHILQLNDDDARCESCATSQHDIRSRVKHSSPINEVGLPAINVTDPPALRRVNSYQRLFHDVVVDEEEANDGNHRHHSRGGAATAGRRPTDIDSVAARQRLAASTRSLDRGVNGGRRQALQQQTATLLNGRHQQGSTEEASGSLVGSEADLYFSQLKREQAEWKNSTSERLNTMFRVPDDKAKKAKSSSGGGGGGAVILRAALERLSFRRSKKKKRRADGSVGSESKETLGESSSASSAKYDVKIDLNQPDDAVENSDLQQVSDIESPVNGRNEVKDDYNQDPVPHSSGNGGAANSGTAKPPLPPSAAGRTGGGFRHFQPPASAKWEQSRPLDQLDSALRHFKSTTAKSRENLSQSRQNMVGLIAAEVNRQQVRNVGTPTAESRQLRPSLSVATNNNGHDVVEGGSEGHDDKRWRGSVTSLASRGQLAPPPKNEYLESEWSRLSASMANLSNRPKITSRAFSEDTWRPSTGGSSQSLSGRTEIEPEPAEELAARPVMGVARAQSIANLPGSQETKLQIPENQLKQQLTPHQARVRASMEKLSVPAWYSNTSATAAAGRSSVGGGRPPVSGWRRHVAANATTATNSRSTTPSVPDPASPYGYGSAAKTRWTARTLPLSYRTGSASSLLYGSNTANGSGSNTPASTLTRNSGSGQPPKQPYLGWRSQERLDIGPTYLATPSQRLASTATIPPSTPVAPGADARASTLPPAHRVSISKEIKETSEAIQDYCNGGSGEDKPNEATTCSSPSSSSSSSGVGSSVTPSPSPPPTQPRLAWQQSQDGGLQALPAESPQTPEPSIPAPTTAKPEKNEKKKDSHQKFNFKNIGILKASRLPAM